MKRVVHLLYPFVILLACRTGNGENSEHIAPTERSVLQYVEVGWNTGDDQELDSLMSDEYVRYLNGLQVALGIVELKAFINNYQNAFPNLRITVESTVVSDIQVAVFWTFEGTNTGVFGEYLPTGKKAVVSGASLFTFDKDGKIAREDTFYNELYLLQQLGYSLIPPNLE